MAKYSKKRNLMHARHTAGLADGVTRELVANKADALLQGKGNKDIMTLLGKHGCHCFSEVASLMNCIPQSRPTAPKTRQLN
jgi:hypothetical protein